MLTLLAFPIPLALAVYFGLRAGRQDPQTMTEFGIVAAMAFLWCLGWVFLWHAIWVSALLPAPWSDTVRSAFSWTAGTGAIWVPVLMITYVLRAMKARRA